MTPAKSLFQKDLGEHNGRDTIERHQRAEDGDMFCGESKQAENTCTGYVRRVMHDEIADAVG